jgi:hypothetical protein
MSSTFNFPNIFESVDSYFVAERLLRGWSEFLLSKILVYLIVEDFLFEMNCSSYSNIAAEVVFAETSYYIFNVQSMQY